MKLKAIHHLVYDLRVQKGILDFDLAQHYGVETRTRNQAVKRKTDRFPKDFMNQQNQQEFAHLKSPIVISNTPDGKASWGGTRKPPHAFTEHGGTMLVSTLKRRMAIQMDVTIVRAFITLKQFAISYKELVEQLIGLKETTENYIRQQKSISNALENLLDEKARQKK